MTVNNIGVFICLQHKLQSGTAEKGETLRIIVISIKIAAIEKILLRMRLNKKTFQAIDKTKIDIAMNMLIIEGNPKATVCFLQPPDPVKAHTVVERKYNLYSIASHFKFTGKALNNVSQSTNLSDRRTF